MVLVPGRFEVDLDAAQEKKLDHVSGRLLYFDRYVIYLGDVCFIQGNTTSSGELFATSRRMFHWTCKILSKSALTKAGVQDHAIFQARDILVGCITAE